MKRRSAEVEEGTTHSLGSQSTQRDWASMPTASPRSRRLHILTVARHPVGGIRTYLKYTYNQFDPPSYKFTIVAPRFPESSLIPGDLSEFEVKLLLTDEEGMNSGLWRTTSAVLNRSPVDLIHSQGLTAGIIVILANWRLRRPHVITHHDVFRRDQFAGSRGWLKRRLLATLLTRSNLVVCVSDDARQNFSEFLPWFPTEKLAVVPNGIDTTAYAEIAGRRALAIGAGRTDSPFTFGFLGRFMPQKGFDVLIAAVAGLVRNSGPLWPFRIMAVGQDDCIGRYKAEIRRRALGAFFEFPGFCNSVADLLGELDCVVVPSRWEAAGLVAMEAMVAGCPLVASDCVGLREVVRGTPALVARAEDSQSLAQQMRLAMERKAELRTLFGNFASVARDRFDVRRASAAMERIFSQLLNPEKPHRASEPS